MVIEWKVRILSFDHFYTHFSPDMLYRLQCKVDTVAISTLSIIINKLNNVLTDR